MRAAVKTASAVMLSHPVRGISRSPAWRMKSPSLSPAEPPKKNLVWSHQAEQVLTSYAQLISWRVPTQFTASVAPYAVPVTKLIRHGFLLKRRNLTN